MVRTAGIVISKKSKQASNDYVLVLLENHFEIYSSNQVKKDMVVIKWICLLTMKFILAFLFLKVSNLILLKCFLKIFFFFEGPLVDVNEEVKIRKLTIGKLDNKPGKLFLLYF